MSHHRLAPPLERTMTVVSRLTRLRRSVGSFASSRALSRRVAFAIRPAPRLNPDVDQRPTYTPLSEKLQSALDRDDNATTDRLFFVDAMCPVNRLHYAVGEDRRFYSAAGEDMTIFKGFMQQLFALLSTEPTPKYCVVAFDARGADFRTLLYPGYKAHREEKPSEILQAVPVIQQALSLLGIKWISAHGIEADDVIGTLAKRFASDDVRVYIFSRDKDFFQLLDENVVMIRGPMREDPPRQGRYDLYTSDFFCQTFGIDPILWAEVLALQGDDADNIPGVAQIGPKRALALVQQYGRIEEIFAHVSEVSGVVARALSAENAEDCALLSRRLVTIPTDLNLPPLRFSLDQAELRMPSDRGRAFLEFAESYVGRSLERDFGRFGQIFA